MNTSIKTLLMATLVMLLACTPAPPKPRVMTVDNCRLVWSGSAEVADNTCPLPDTVRAAVIVLAKASSLEAYKQQIAELESLDFENEQAILVIGLSDATFSDGYHLLPEEAVFLLNGNPFVLLLTDASGAVLMQSDERVSAQALADALNPRP